MFQADCNTDIHEVKFGAQNQYRTFLTTQTILRAELTVMWLGYAADLYTSVEFFLSI